MARRLLTATSPYLRQHANNPVDWYSWGDEAFEEAASRDLPVFISIGYAACHWCHVMAHESFEDREVASILNDSFINIKVDREEHPTVDHFYMSACTAMGQRGGWPLTIIARPDRIPVYCATYLPKRSVHGRLGLIDLAERFSQVWNSDRTQIEAYGNDLVKALEQQSTTDDTKPIEVPSSEKSVMALKSRFDPEWGGFGDAPKFPTAHQLSFLLRAGTREKGSDAYNMVDKTIRSIRQGGVFDQVGLGIHRYSTDRQWKLPHFEKMLVDQAMFVITCTEAFQVSKDVHHKSSAADTIEYVLRDLQAPEGAFYASEDADSEGEEGIFYLWSWQELSSILSRDELAYATEEWNLVESGNVDDEATGDPTGLNLFFNGDPYPTGQENDVWQSIRQKLNAVRTGRIRPTRDEKILTDWNGAMIAALALAGRTFGNNEWIAAAEQSTDFLLSSHTSDLNLIHSSFEGISSEMGSLDDYAFFSWGLLELFSASGKAKWLRRCRKICDTMLDLFWADNSAGFYLTSDGAHQLPVRQKQFHDGATPAGGSVAAYVLLKLAVIFGDDRYEEVGRKQVQASLAASSGFVLGFSSTFSTAQLIERVRKEVVITSGRGGEALIQEVNKAFLPESVIIPATDDGLTSALPHVSDYVAVDGLETVYVCSDRVCDAPVTELEDLKLSLKN